MYDKYEFIKVTKRKQGKKAYCPPTVSFAIMTDGINKLLSNFFGLQQDMINSHRLGGSVEYTWHYLATSTSIIIRKFKAMERRETQWVSGCAWNSPIVPIAPPKKGNSLAVIA